MSKDIEPTEKTPDLARVRERIDGIDRTIQDLIAERARWAHQVGLAKGPLAAAVDYYRPEREAQVLRMVVDRNEGPLSDEVLVHVFREIMSACLAQQEPLKIGFLGPEGTFSQQAVLKHFRPLGARPATGQHRRGLPGSGQRWCGFRRGSGRELGAGHDPDHTRHVPHFRHQDLR